MRFRQLDRIVQLTPGEQIVAERRIGGDDRFYQDHFPRFPVFPGVLILEAMFQAGDWLVRASEDFANSVVLLKEARNVKFSDMVRPGSCLTVSAELKHLDERRARLECRVLMDGQPVSRGRLVLERFNLADEDPRRAVVDEYLRQRRREEFALLAPAAEQHCPVIPTSFRWLWIDRFTGFERGRVARARKTVSLSDEPLDMYQPGFPVMPASLIIEGFAQTGGILSSEIMSFQQPVVLAKVRKAVFHRPAVAGDTIEFAAEVLDIETAGAIVGGVGRIDGETQCEVELFFAYLNDRLENVPRPSPGEIVKALRLYGLFDVASGEGGERLAVPTPMLQAEQEELSRGSRDFARTDETSSEGDQP